MNNKDNIKCCLKKMQLLNRDHKPCKTLIYFKIVFKKKWYSKQNQKRVYPRADFLILSIKYCIFFILYANTLYHSKNL